MHCEISAPFDGKKSECVYIKTSKELSKSFFGMKQPQNLKKKKNKFTLQRIPVVFKINFWMNYAGMFWKQRTKGKKTSNLRLLNYTADCSVSVFRASVTSMEEISCRCEGGRVENGWRAEILSAQSLKKGESGGRTSCPCVVWCSMYTDGCVRHVFVAVVIASAENVLPLTSGLFFDSLFFASLLLCYHPPGCVFFFVFFVVTHLPKTLTRLHRTSPTTCFSFLKHTHTHTLGCFCLVWSCW